jgi:hypothetical protein
MNSENPEPELSEAELNELIAQLQSDEQTSLESTLESEISFRNWISGNPAMRQMLIPEKVSDIVPAVLKFLRYMLGLDKEPPQISGQDIHDEGEDV